METIRHYLYQLYADDQADDAYDRLHTMIAQASQKIEARTTDVPFSERDIVLITYGDTMQAEGQTPLQSLRQFSTEYLKGAVSTIHILPFYPYSSDDGFSVEDFYAVRPALGTWQDVSDLGEAFDLMFDAVFNHMSAQSKWFTQWLAGDPEYAGLFMTADPSLDLSDVTRPRATPLLTPFKKSDGETVHVWTTFSDDQVDFDVRHPDTLLRLIDILLFYVEKGARVIRLDAIAYLWKQIGTTCIHLEQTHTAIKLMRAVLDAVAPQVILITETNVPHQENISYFGNGYDEAQMVYNFTLPPLLFFTMLTGDTTRFRQWVDTLSTPSPRTTFFNFTASHDGIGVRPVEGILTDDELALLIEHTESTGGQVSYKQNKDGSKSPYELNVTYVDAIAGRETSVEKQSARFLTSQAIAMSLAGVPAVYIHSLLGSRNDLEGMARTGRSRSINRASLRRQEVEADLKNPERLCAQIFHPYRKLLRLRAAQPAFHPNAIQRTHDLDNPGVFCLERHDPTTDQTILCLFNVTSETQTVDVSPVAHGPQKDLITGSAIADANAVQLHPYQSLWLVTT